MSDTWRALVLSSGGASGEHQIGALPVVAEHYDRFDFVSGSGIGSLLASVLAQFDRFPQAVTALLALWEQVDGNDAVFETSIFGPVGGAIGALISDQSWAAESVYGNKKLERLIERHIHWGRLRDRNNWAISLTSLTDGRLYTLSNDQRVMDARNPADGLVLSVDPESDNYVGDMIPRLITAGGSVPFMLPPVDAFGHRLVEGGIRDTAPIATAIDAYRLALAERPGLVGEFLVLHNFTAELPFEPPEALDSGQEILGHTLKIITHETAVNDFAEAEQQLADLRERHDASVSMTTIRPEIDYHIGPIDFDDHERRGKIRRHGRSRAMLVLGVPDSGSPNPHLEAIDALRAEPESEDRAAAIVKLALRDPAGALAAVTSGEPSDGLGTDGTAAGIEFEAAAEDDRDSGEPSASPENIRAPADLFELGQVMREAHATNRRLKAVAGSFAFDNIVDTDGLLVDMQSFDAIDRPDGRILVDGVDHESLCRLEAGATIEDLNLHLWAQGQALINQPGYEGLTFVGTASVGGHGSGTPLPGLSESIRSIDLVHYDPDGRLVQKRVEPSDGITDPAAFAEHYRFIELVQEDDLFHACTVGLGVLGIIYRVIIDVQDSFWLEERRYVEPWSSVKTRVMDLTNDPAVHSVHVWLNPYEVDGDHRCVISEYHLAAPGRRGTRGFGVTFALVDELAPVLQFIMSSIPDSIPGILNSALEATTPAEDEVVVLPVFEAINFGVPNLVAVEAAAGGVPASEMVSSADELIALYRERKEQKHRYVTSAIGFRFVKRARAFMSMQFERDTCMIEVPVLKGTPGEFGTLSAFHDRLFEQPWHVRPHWGQINRRLDAARAAELYPKLGEFAAARRRLDPLGKFSNDFTRQLGWPDVP